MLRSKSNAYKRKRQEINDMTAELQLLKRTEELLKEQVEQIKSRMVRRKNSEHSIDYSINEMSQSDASKTFTLIHIVDQNDRLEYFDLFRVQKNVNKVLKDIFQIKNVLKNYQH